MKHLTIASLLATPGSAALTSYNYSENVASLKSHVTKPTTDEITQFDHPANFNPVLPLANPVGVTAGGALFYKAFPYADLALSQATLKTQSRATASAVNHGSDNVRSA